MHGLAKLERGVDVFAAALAGLHLPAPHFLAWVTGIVEAAGGIALNRITR